MKIERPPREHPVSLEHPSRSATERVKDPLPIPTTCPNCDGPVRAVNNQEIYGRPFGDWPYAYACACCDSYVGMHPCTNIPLGTLADAPTREARKVAKKEFSWMYQPRHAKSFTRSEAYVWLALKMQLAPGTAHIGWFNVAQCAAVVSLVQAYRQSFRPAPKPKVKPTPREHLKQKGRK